MNQQTIFNESPITACWDLIMPPRQQPVIEAKDIIKLVCIQSGFTYKDLQHKTRMRETVEARHIAMMLIYRYTSHTLKSIGEMFGNRDHTTVIASINVMCNLMQTSPKIRAKIESVERSLSVSGSFENFIKRLDKSGKVVKIKQNTPIKRHIGYYSNSTPFNIAKTV